MSQFPWNIRLHHVPIPVKHQAIPCPNSSWRHQATPCPNCRDTSGYTLVPESRESGYVPPVKHQANHVPIPVKHQAERCPNSLKHQATPGPNSREISGYTMSQFPWNIRLHHVPIPVIRLHHVPIPMKHQATMTQFKYQATPFLILMKNK